MSFGHDPFLVILRRKGEVFNSHQQKIAMADGAVPVIIVDGAGRGGDDLRPRYTEPGILRSYELFTSLCTISNIVCKAAHECVNAGNIWLEITFVLEINFFGYAGLWCYFQYFFA